MWGDRDGNGSHDGWGMMGGSSGGLAWLLVLLLVLVLLAATVSVLLALRRPLRVAQSGNQSGNQSGTPPESAAKRALDERFARGDIEEDEYRRRLSVLREH
jgi:putative membrane protein